MINIITRTHLRPKRFKICRDSVCSQVYKAVNHIVGSDTTCDYFDAIKLAKKSHSVEKDEIGKYPAPYNLHLDELAKRCQDGYVMYLDDDDMFVDNNSLQEIMNHVSEESVTLWKVNINGRIVPCDDNFGKIIPNDISGIGFCFHTKHLPVNWGSWTGGDYRVIKHLTDKLEMIWIDKILTKTQGKPNRGRRCE